jgi:hypothetical protein
MLPDDVLHSSVDVSETSPHEARTTARQANVTVVS